MTGDTIDLRQLDPYTAARYAALADRYRDRPEEQAPLSEPGEETRRLADQLPGDEGEFGWVGRRWSRRGGVLARARFLEMRGRTTFQDHGPVLDTVLRVRPADGTPPFDAARRLTIEPDGEAGFPVGERTFVVEVVGGKSQTVRYAGKRVEVSF